MAYRKSHRSRFKRRLKARNDWPGEPIRHKKAARKGWRSHAKPGWSPKRSSKRRRAKRDHDVSSDWREARGFGGRKAPRHAQAAARGWRVTSRRGWRPKRPKWKGKTTSTAGHRARRKGYVAGMSKAERSARNKARFAALQGRARAARLPRGKSMDDEVEAILKSRRAKKSSGDYSARMDWPGQPRRHAKAAKKGWGRRRRAGRSRRA